MRKCENADAKSDGDVDLAEEELRGDQGSELTIDSGSKEDLGTSDQSEFTIEGSIFSRFRLLAERAFAACAKRGYTGAMRAARKIRYRLEWRKFATKFVPLLSRKA